MRISAILAGSDGPSDNNRQHGRTDDELRHAGIASVILRPHFFMQNLLADVASLRSDGVIYAAAGDARLGMIDTRDIADVATKALLDPSWDGNTYDLTGPDSISFHDIARQLSELVGREIRYVPMSPDRLAQSIRDVGSTSGTPRATTTTCAPTPRAGETSPPTPSQRFPASRPGRSRRSRAMCSFRPSRQVRSPRQGAR